MEELGILTGMIVFGVLVWLMNEDVLTPQAFVAILVTLAIAVPLARYGFL